MIFADAKFWVSMAFIAFILAIFRPVGRAIVGMLDDRSQTIKSELDEAVRLKEEAQAVYAAYQRKQRETMEEAKLIIEHAEEEAKRIMAQAKKDIELDINRRVDMAMQKISQTESNTLQEVRSRSVDIAIQSVKTLLSETMQKDVAEKLIEHSIKDMQEKFH